MGGFFKAVGIGCTGLIGLVIIGIVVIAVVGTSGGAEGSDRTVSGAAVQEQTAADAGTANGTDQAPDGSGERPAAVGQTITVDGMAVTLMGAEYVDSVGMWAPAEDGYVYLVLDVKIVNVGEKEKKSFNSLYFSAKDTTNGFTYDDTGINPTEQPLNSGELSSGDLIRGSVVLKIGEESRDVRVKYDPIGADPFYWSVPQA